MTCTKTPIELYPILLSVFYSGRKRRAQLPALRTLIEMLKDLGAFMPAWGTLF